MRPNNFISEHQKLLLNEFLLKCWDKFNLITTILAFEIQNKLSNEQHQSKFASSQIGQSIH